MHPTHAVRLAAFLFIASQASAQAQTASPSAQPPISAASAAERQANGRQVIESQLGMCVSRPPAYPQEALRSELTGRSLVVFTVTAEGNLENPGLLRSSGHAVLDEAALSHLNRCIAASTAAEQPKLPQGRYALPLLWRIE